MKVVLAKDSKDLGYLAAKHAAKEINATIAKDGNARILLSTGASQFTFFEQFVKIVFRCFRKVSAFKILHQQFEFHVCHNSYPFYLPAKPASLNFFLFFRAFAIARSMLARLFR